MQLAMKASPAPRRSTMVACCNRSKQTSSIALGAAKTGVTLITVRQAETTAISTYLGFMCLSAMMSSRAIGGSTSPDQIAGSRALATHRDAHSKARNPPRVKAHTPLHSLRPRYRTLAL